MGRKSNLTDHQWEKLQHHDLHRVAVALLSISDNEKAVTQVLRLMLLFGDLQRVLKVKPISRYKFEFPVNSGRIDLLLFHNDGGISIVEAKADRLPREIALGIGQLCMYEAGLRKKMRPAYINRILIAPIKSENSLEIMSACELAGVKFIHLPKFKKIKGDIEAILNDEHG